MHVCTILPIWNITIFLNSILASLLSLPLYWRSLMLLLLLTQISLLQMFNSNTLPSVMVWITRCSCVKDLVASGWTFERWLEHEGYNVIVWWTIKRHSSLQKYGFERYVLSLGPLLMLFVYSHSCGVISFLLHTLPLSSCSSLIIGLEQWSLLSMDWSLWNHPKNKHVMVNCSLKYFITIMKNWLTHNLYLYLAFLNILKYNNHRFSYFIF